MKGHSRDGRIADEDELLNELIPEIAHPIGFLFAAILRPASQPVKEPLAEVDEVGFLLAVLDRRREPVVVAPHVEEVGGDQLLFTSSHHQVLWIAQEALARLEISEEVARGVELPEDHFQRELIQNVDKGLTRFTQAYAERAMRLRLARNVRADGECPETPRKVFGASAVR